MVTVNEEETQLDRPSRVLIAKLLRQKISNILILWERWVRKEVEAARELHPTDLKNSLPKVLENLAQALEYQAKGGLPEVKVAREHGRERSAFPQYTLEQIIAEYRLLRRAIFEVIGKNISDQERDTIIDAIEIGISESASEFTKQQFAFREQFVSMLAHDLRNPLSAAKTSAQLILRTPVKSKVVETMAVRIVSTIDRTDNLIKDLLDSNLVQMGQKIPLEITECNLYSVIKSSLEEVTSIYGERFKINSDPHIVGYWDPKMLQRAVGNLLTNAIKYGSPNSPVLITMSLAASQVQIDIHNEGEVIPLREQKGLFDNFYRTSGVREGHSVGWGLGLFLVKGAILAHGGSVSVKSRENDGTTFTLTFPKDCRSKLEINPNDKASPPKLLH